MSLMLGQIPSLYRNPSAIDFELASIADLILDPTIKAAVQDEIDSRIQVSQVTSTALALVMWETLVDLRSDSGSIARNSEYRDAWQYETLTDTVQACPRRPSPESKAGTLWANMANQAMTGTRACPEDF